MLKQLQKFLPKSYLQRLSNHLHHPILPQSPAPHARTAKSRRRPADREGRGAEGQGAGQEDGGRSAIGARGAKKQCYITPHPPPQHLPPSPRSIGTVPWEGEACSFLFLQGFRGWLKICFFTGACSMTLQSPQYCNTYEGGHR